MLRSHCELCNAALQERRDAWKLTRTAVRYGDQSAQLAAIREVRPDQGVWSFSSQQATLRRLGRAFEAFFRRCRRGEKPGYPRFRSQRRFDSVEWPKDGDGCRWLPDDKRVYLQGVGQVKVHQHRLVEGVVKTIQVKREGRHWYLVLSCDHVPVRPLPKTGAAVGLDMGVGEFCVTSDGTMFANPGHLKQSAGKLAVAQRAFARTKKGSGRRRKAAQRIGGVHRKVARQRRDIHHKVARDLVYDYDLLVHEDLRIANMTKAARGTDAEPNMGRSAKAGLNKSILDAGWGGFLAILHGKAEEAGRCIVSVDPRHTSQRCPECGHVDAANRATRARFCCQACGYEAHADVVGATNVLRLGLSLQEASSEAC